MYHLTNLKDLKIEFKNLEELQDFVKVVGDVVLSEDEILVYNDYIE